MLDHPSLAQTVLRLLSSKPSLPFQIWVLAQEEQELQELLAAMEAEPQIMDDVSQHYGSDDDDFDSIFMECAMNSDLMEQGRPAITSSDPDDMDMTDG